MQLLPLQFSQSLVRNGNFTEGTSGWHGQFLTHLNIKGDFVGANFTNSPAYGVTIQGGTADYSDSLPRGMYQFLDNLNFVYPAVRNVTNLELRYLGANRVKLTSNSSTKLNKLLLRDGIAGAVGSKGFATNAFRYLGEDGIVQPTNGTDIILSGDVKTRGKISGLSLDPTLPQLHEVSHDSLIVELDLDEDSNGFASNEVFPTVFVEWTFLPTTGVGVLQFKGLDFAAIQTVQRPDGTLGLRTQDTVQLGLGGPIVQILSVATTTTSNSFNVSFTNIEGETPITSAGTSTVWEVFAPITVNAYFTLPVVQYMYTLCLTEATGGADSSASGGIVHYKLSSDTEIDGIGYAWEPIGSVSRTVVPLQTVLSTGAVFENSQWQRVFVLMTREYIEPIQARAVLFIEASVLSGTQATIGDIALYHGDRTEFQLNNNESSGLLDGTASIDPIVTQVDPLNGVMPKGAVILYTGSACPAGYKRVDSRPFSSISERGDELYYELPAPASTLYSSSEDKTSLTWTGISFPALDEQGQEIPLTSLATVLDLDLSGTTQSVSVQPVLQALQPGRSIRARQVQTPPTRPGFTEFDKNAPFEDLNRSFLITDLNPVGGGELASQNSSKPYINPTRPVSSLSPFGQGQGTIDYPSTVRGSFSSENTYPNVPPAGPKRAEQTEIFETSQPFAYIRMFDRTSTGGGGDLNQNNVMLCNPVSNVTFPGNISVNFNDGPHAGTTHVITPQNNAAELITNNDVLYAEMYGQVFDTSGNVRSPEALVFIDAFPCIIEVLSGGSSFRMYRYDIRPIKTLGFDNSFTFNFRDTVGQGFDHVFRHGIVILRPVKLYGFDTTRQVLKPALDGTGNTPQGTGEGFIQQRLSVNGSAQWVTRVFGTGLSLKVAGNLNPTDKQLLLEPTGYLRYDTDPMSIDFGAGGHIHSVSPGPSASVDLPRVRIQHPSAADYPPRFLPASHGHGILGEYMYPMPLAQSFTLCQKL